MRMSSMVIAMMLTVLVFAVVAPADDTFPPTWRGLEGTTVQEWEFTAPGPNYGPPDGALFDNPYGDPVAYDDPGGWPSTWRSSHGGRDGVLEFIGPYALVFDIPNRDLPNEEKWIQIQTTFYSPQFYPMEQGPAGVNIVYDSSVYSSDQPPTPQSWSSLGDGWYMHVFDIVLPWNPVFERIELYWDSAVFEPYFVDQVVIDTYCVPEPASLGLMAAGAVLLLRRRRR